jgi:hypothetical protein
MPVLQTVRAFMLVALAASSAAAQTLDDAFLLRKQVLSGGVLYAHDSWEQYWEGTLKRTNGNIGTMTTQSVTAVGGYGLSDRFTLMAVLPYVWTEASRGTLRGMSGVQDLTIGAKYQLLTAEVSGHGAFNALVSGAVAIPVSDYTPDFLPLSIGTGGARASGRATLSFRSTSAWFAAASAAYTWCANVKLDRNAYYTDGRLYLTNDVAMPNVADYALSVGVERGRWRIPISFVQQRTLGGGDIRRQDMPFVSNRMDFARLDGAVMYRLSNNVAVRLGAAHVVSGRNVGESTTLTSGVFYAVHF